MYELFMTAFLSDIDYNAAASIISGYCWDTPHKRLYRVLYFAGANPNNPKPLTKTRSIHGLSPEPDPFSFGLSNTDPAPPPSARFVDAGWSELSDILKRQMAPVHPEQSYIVNTRYEVLQDRDFGNAESTAANHFDVNPGALFWSEMPDPASVAGGQALIMQRKKIEIHAQLNLPTVLKENDFRFKAESIEETHDIYHREAPVEFHLTRAYKLPTGADQPSASLPPLESLQKVDPAGRWMLTVVAYVMDDQSPDRIKAARDALTQVWEDLTPCGITFKQIDRRYYDTQLAAARKPATQSFGQTQSLAGVSGSGV